MAFLDRSDHIRDELYRDISEGDVLGSGEEWSESENENDNDFTALFDDDLLHSGEVSTMTTPSMLGEQENEEHEQDSDSVPANPAPTGDTPQCPICKWVHNGEFQPLDLPFDTTRSGIIFSNEIVGNEWKEVDAFYEFLDYDLVNHIASETNKYYKECVNDVRSQFSKLNQWVDTNTDEMFCFLATSLLMPHVGKNTLKQYWSTDPLIETPVFSKIFTQDRYLNIRRMLHFDDNCLITGGDKLFKIRTVIETLRKKFSSVLNPFQNLVIDESLMLWKGRLSFRQYIPNKRKRFGIKLFVLCDCKTGMILDFIVYTGKGTNISIDNNEDTGLSSKVIRSLMQPYLGKNHILYMDNWYSSPELFSWLYDQNTGACGTLRATRKYVPCLPKKMKKGEVVARHNEKMLAIRWCDKRQVTMLSTVDKNEMTTVNTRSFVNKEKPKCVINYNNNMGAVDRSDMMVSFNDSTRKTIKWYSKLFFHLLDICVLNAFYMFKEHQKKTNPAVKLRIMEFRLNLIRQLFENHFTAKNAGKNVARPIGGGTKDPLRLQGRHFMRPLPQSETKKRKLLRQCYLCKHTSRSEPKRKETSYECSTCDIALCVHPCFEQYHTLKKF